MKQRTRALAGKVSDDSPIPATNEIVAFLHCRQCLLEMPDGYSPQTWSQLEIGWTRLGIQVWCRRHESNILHMDFEGHKHPARTSGTGATVRTAQ